MTTIEKRVTVLALQVERVEPAVVHLHRLAMLRKVAMHSALLGHRKGHAVVLFHAKAREKALVRPGEERGRRHQGGVRRKAMHGISEGKIETIARDGFRGVCQILLAFIRIVGSKRSGNVRTHPA